MKKLILIFSVVFLISACAEQVEIESYSDTTSAISFKVGSPRDKRLTYFDVNEYKQIRSIPNNLSSGDLTGRVQFAQTHTIDPNGNEEKKQPSLIPYRDSLLLFTPQVANLKSLKATVTDKYKDETKTIDLNMDPPIKMPKSDYNNGNGKPDITYSKRSWSARMPYNVVSPEMIIKFTAETTDGLQLIGELLGKDIEFAAPIEAVFLHIKLGMVTDRVVTKADYPQYISFDMIEEPEWSLAEYFQTVPFAKMVNGQYEDRVLPKVIIKDGTIYHKNHLSPFKKPNVHNGDMREDVAKATVSVGINLANKGVASSPLDQNHERSDDLFYFTLHHAIGNYENNANYDGVNKGFTMHGMSGGNGIGTLYMSSGNEFSHEVGHAYAAVGHLPYISESSEGSIHSYNTGWGYDAYRNRMRANIDWQGQNIHSYDKKGWWITPFQETYQWNSDAQASGIPNGSISRYTHSTAWTTMAVQKKMAGRYFLMDNPQDGEYKYQGWDVSARRHITVDPNFYEQWNPTEKKGTPGKLNRINPSRVGVPVITILGGYDPANPNKTLLYKYFRGNWGNVFDKLFLDSKPTDTTAYLEIEYYDNKPNKYVKLYDKRYSDTIINKLHVNIAENDKPKTITLYVNGQNKGSTTIEEKVYDNPMVQAVTIGKEHGYKQVIEADIKYLQDNLTNMNKDNYILDYKAKNRLDTLIYHNKLDNLTGNAKIIAEDYKNTQEAFDKIDMTIENNYVALENNDSVADEELRKVIKDVGFGEVTYVFNQAIINGKCIEVKYGEESSRQLVVANCNETPNQRWAMDSKGRIHSAIMPGYCLSSDRMEKLVLCSASDRQKWKINETHKDKGIVYESVSNDGKCIDHNVGKNVIGIYNCTGNKNQIFKDNFYKDDAKYFAIMDGSLIEEIWKYIPATKGDN